MAKPNFDCKATTGEFSVIHAARIVAAGGHANNTLEEAENKRLQVDQSHVLIHFDALPPKELDTAGHGLSVMSFL
jgi:hypothetical protein